MFILLRFAKRENLCEVLEAGPGRAEKYIDRENLREVLEAGPGRAENI